MNRAFYPGGSYVDALPSGERCVLFPGSHVSTHLGAIALPPGEAYGILYLRLTTIEGFRFAGQAHDTVPGQALNYEWSGDWQPRPAVYQGVSPVIYDRAGRLHMNDGSWGSQGARYVTIDNQIVTADATYFSREMDLSEWTEIMPGLCIGQAHPDAAHDAAWVWDRGTLRLLEAGPCRFIRANRDGEAVAIALVKADGAAIYQTTVAELRALPRVRLTPIPVPVPLPPVPPRPVPPPPPPENQMIEIVRAVRAKYPRSNPGSSPLGEDAWRAIVEVAQRAGGKVFRKDGGDNTFIPAGLLAQYPQGVHISRTIIGRGSLGNQWVKVFSDGEGGAGPIWNVGDTPADGEYIDVSSIALTDAPPVPVPPPPTVPPPAQPPPTPPPADDEARFVALESKVRTLRAQVADLMDAIGELEVVGKTGTSTGHKHSVKLAVSRRQ